MSFKVIKSSTNQKLVYDFLLVLTFAVSRTVYKKFDVRQSNDLEISPRSPTVISLESCNFCLSYLSPSLSFPCLCPSPFLFSLSSFPLLPFSSSSSHGHRDRIGLINTRFHSLIHLCLLLT